MTLAVPSVGAADPPSAAPRETNADPTSPDASGRCPEPIDAAHFERERRLDHWRVLDLSSPSAGDAASLSRAEPHSTATPEHDRRLAARAVAMGPPAPGQLTLVASDTPSDYPRFRRIAVAAGWRDVFYLDGGHRAHRRLLATQDALRRYTPGRVSAPRSCRGAG